MTRHSTLLLTAAALLWAPVSAAQTLQQYLDSADQKNPDRRLAHAAVKQAAANASVAWGGLLPSLSATGNVVHNQYDAIINAPNPDGTFTTVTITPINQQDLGFRADLPLLDASRWLRTSAAFAGVEAEEAREASSLNRTHQKVVVAYYAFAGARALLKSTLKSLAVAEAQEEQQRARNQAGVATELEWMRAKAEVERNRQQVADSESLYATHRRSLQSVSGLTPLSEPSLPEDDLAPERPEPELEALADGLPSVVAADKDVLVASRGWTATVAALIPTVGAQFTQRFTNATGFAGQSAFWNAGLGLAWRVDVPAFQQLRVASAQEQAAAITAEKVRIEARDLIHSTWQDVVAAITKVRASRAQTEAARRAAELARERYGAGVANQLDVIQADRDVLSAEVNDIKSRFDLASARAALRIAAGLPVTSAP